jgi:hypothetical protein
MKRTQAESKRRFVATLYACRRWTHPLFATQHFPKPSVSKVAFESLLQPVTRVLRNCLILASNVPVIYPQ